MQYGDGRNKGVGFFLLAVEGGSCKHSEADHSLVRHFDAHLRCPNAGIENGSNVADAPRDHFVGICIQPNLSGFTDADVGQIVFIDVANYPNIGKVRNRKRA